MSTTKHRREVAKLDRVPLPVEAIRIGMTGWQLLRTLARVVTKLPAGGALPDKVVRAIPQTFADLGPTYVKFGQIMSTRRDLLPEGARGEFLADHLAGSEAALEEPDLIRAEAVAAASFGGQ